MHVSRLERARKFPQRGQVGANRVAWWESEVLEWAEALPRGPLQISVAGAEAA